MHKLFELTASALTINIDPLRRCEVRDEAVSNSACEESQEKKLELGAAIKLTLLVTLQGR